MLSPKLRVLLPILVVGMAVAIVAGGCAGPQGPVGPPGAPGPAGPVGPPGKVPQFTLNLDPNKPGCGGLCHEKVVVPGPEGKYTLAYEANHAYPGHKFDPQAKLLTLNDCLKCHAVGPDGKKGTVASKPLRDIVHEVHLNSEHFTDKPDRPELQGTCFTCHILSGPSTLGLTK